MPTLQTPQGECFTSGRATFRDHTPERRERTAKVFVQVELRGPNGQIQTLAQLDTGAAWSVLDAETADALGISYQDGEPVSMRTARGDKGGRLVRIPITLLAEEGSPLELTDVTFLVIEDWPADQVFLGYSGLLDSIRVALDPVAYVFYFGECARSS